MRGLKKRVCVVRVSSANGVFACHQQAQLRRLFVLFSDDSKVTVVEFEASSVDVTSVYNRETTRSAYLLFSRANVFSGMNHLPSCLISLPSLSCVSRLDPTISSSCLPPHLLIQERRTTASRRRACETLLLSYETSDGVIRACSSCMTPSGAVSRTHVYRTTFSSVI